MDEDDMDTPRPISLKPVECNIDEDNAATPKAEPQKSKSKTIADLTRSSQVVPPTSILSSKNSHLIDNRANTDKCDVIVLKSILEDILLNIAHALVGICLTIAHTISLLFFLVITIFMIWPSYAWDFFVLLKLVEEKKRKKANKHCHGVCASDEISVFELEELEDVGKGNGGKRTCNCQAT